MRRVFKLLLPLLLLAAPLGAAEPEPALAPGETLLLLAETAEKQVRRDILRAELRVEATASSPRAVQNEVNRRMAAALDRVRVVPTVKAETGGHAAWEERPEGEAVRWRGSQSLILKGRESDKLLQLVGELQGDGLLLGSLQHELAPESARALEDELTEAALERLRARAETIARSMGLEVARWHQFRVGNASSQPGRPPMPMMRAAAAESAFAPPVAEAGETPVRLTVEAEIVLGPPPGGGR
jgi:predicted secreted protein